MSGTVFLDSSPLGLLTQKPDKSLNADACQQWLRKLTVHGWAVCLPEITDYEVRRELIQSRSWESVHRLDQLITQVNYIPITTPAMLQAAILWAQARRSGWATADPKALDGDVILAAQALTLLPAPANLVVATSNAADLSRYIRAQDWATIMASTDLP